jgi:hydroxypyruvate isomerase
MQNVGGMITFIRRYALQAATGVAAEDDDNMRALPLIGEIQVADVPGRHKPGTGEIHYPAIAAALRRLEYDGVIGLEGWASGEPEQALHRFRSAFSTN